jgi:hypothetical protein
MWMNAKLVMESVIRHALTLMALSCALVEQGTLWQLMVQDVMV